MTLQTLQANVAIGEQLFVLKENGQYLPVTPTPGVPGGGAGPAPVAGVDDGGVAEAGTGGAAGTLVYVRGTAIGQVLTWNGTAWVAPLNLFETQLVYRPGGVAGGNVFTDWATLVTFAASIPDPKVIVFDDTNAAIVIPVGAWDLGRGCQFWGFVPSTVNSASSLRTTITCADGVTFVTPLYAIRDVQLLYTGTHALMTIPGTGRRWNFYMLGNAVCATTGAGGRIFDLIAASSFGAFFEQQSFVTVAGGSFFWSVAAGATVAAITTRGDGFNPPATGARLPANSLSGAAGPTYQFVQDFNGMLSPTQASMPGGVITLGTEASPANIPYTPSDPTKWNGNPTTLQQAIDRIAAVVGTPIPIP